MKLNTHLPSLCTRFRKFLLLGALACTSFGIASAQAANILVVAGSNSFAQVAAGVLNTELTAAGNTVTVVNTGVPVSLAGFTQIYDTRYDNSPAFSPAEMSQYLAFLNASPSNTIFLMGENTGFNARNIPINNFISLAGGGTIAPPARTSQNSETVNSPFTGPSAISTVKYAACGLVTSSGTGSFASSEAGGGCSIYFGLGSLANATQGALVVVYDVNFIASAPDGGAVNEILFRQNLEQFVSSPGTIPVPASVSAVSPNMGSASGGTAVTITGTGFTGALGVTFGGGAATNVNVVSDTSITATTPPGRSGTASVVVSTPGGATSANSLFTYVDVSVLQIYPSAAVNLQVVKNQSLIVSGVANVQASQPAPWQATTTTPWLTLNLPTGSFPGVVSVTANATGMAVGAYTGAVIVGSGGQTLTIPVTLTVLAPQSVMVSPSSISFASGYPAGSATGYDIQVGPAGMAFTAQTSASSNGWLSISPTSGVGPATIHVTTDPSKATPGTYQDSIVIMSPGAPNSPMSIPVRLSVSSLFLTLPQQTNGATGAGPDHTVAPNEIASLFLSDFNCSAQPVVSMNGTAVAWSSYNSGQINYAVPAGLSAPATLSVACNGATAWNFNGLNVAATMPGIFTVAGQAAGVGQAMAANADGTSNGPANAAARGTYVSLYVSGFGVFSAASADGMRHLAGSVTGQVGGVAATVQYAGEAPGSTDGLQQINLMLPMNSPMGASVPVMLWVDGTPTQATVTLAVK